jgi:glyoxylate reductase
MKVFASSPLPERALRKLKEFCPQSTVRRVRSSRDLVRGARDADGLICVLTDSVDASVLRRCRRLKAISTVSVGTDHIDLEACAARGIQVFSTPAVLTETTADFTWALLLAAARRLPEGDRFARAGRFRGWSLDLLLGVDVFGKTIGIVGPGRIGTAVARRAAGFGMRILTSGRQDRPGSVPLDQLLAESDFVVLTVPLNAQTRRFIGDREFAKMRTTAVLVNVSRGAVVDEGALVRALRSGRIFAAGLDVYEREPRVPAALRRLDNVVLAPHMASASAETRERMALSAVEQLVRALQ